jgi:hypothetical protein
MCASWARADADNSDASKMNNIIFMAGVNKAGYINKMLAKLLYIGNIPCRMAFSKRFPRSVKGSPYAQWEEVKLSDEEERQIDGKARADNNRIFLECIDDAKEIIKEKGLKGYETGIVEIAKALFEKRASHAVYWKEKRTKEKFDATT